MSVCIACLLIALVFATSQRRRAAKNLLHSLRDTMGLNGISLVIIWAVAMVWTAIVCLLLFGLVRGTLGLIWLDIPIAKTEVWDWRFSIAQIVALTTVLGAVLAFPFTLVRLEYNSRQTKTAEQVHITDRIGQAVEQLGNTNVAVRMGAIHSLERVMRDSEEDRVMIMRTLNAYLDHKN